MAGDWIKVQTCTPDKPEVFKMARSLGIDRDTVVGKLVRFWSWLDQVCVDGYVDGLSSQDVDGIVGQPNFSTSLTQVNWVEFDLNDLGEQVGFRVINFEAHNGKSSKNRALKTERQRKWRKGQPVDGPASTREEKRRVRDRSNDLSRSNQVKTGSNDPTPKPKDPPATPCRFGDFWSAYPKKVKKKAAMAKWQSRMLDKQADMIIADIHNRSQNDGRWLDGFVPDPTTYINGDLWNDELQARRTPNGTHQQSLTGNAASYAVAEEWARDQIAGTDTERTIDGEARRVHAAPVAKVR